MIKSKFKYFYVILLVTLLGNIAFAGEYSLEDFEHYIEYNMKETELPGVGVVVIKDGKTIIKKGFGYADIKNKIEVDNDTLFELGSNSKAFTAVGILKLLDSGKLKLDDYVDQYVPYFKMRYNDVQVRVKIKQLLEDKSGIPFDALNGLFSSTNKESLKETIIKVSKKNLLSKPGDEFIYSALNYDVLGEIIENVTGLSFEEYMVGVMNDLKLNSTILDEEHVNKAKGYKYYLWSKQEYDAEIYQSNKPSGYFLSNNNDMEKWLKIQLGLTKVDFAKKIIEENNKNFKKTESNFFYSNGWYYADDEYGKQICHGGTNPNFTSYVVIRPDKKVAVAVMCNINSISSVNICEGLVNMAMGIEPKLYFKDNNKLIDRISTIILMMILVLFILYIVLYIKLIKKIIAMKERKFSISIEKRAGLVLAGGIAIFISAFIYSLPYLMTGLSWKIAAVFMPNSFKIASMVVFAYTWTAFLYVILKHAYIERNKVKI